MAGLDGFVIVAPRGRSFLEHALDHPPADLHAKARDGSPVRQRKNVGRFERLLERVDERLPHIDLGEQSVDPGTDVERLERRASSSCLQRAETSFFFPGRQATHFFIGQDRHRLVHGCPLSSRAGR